MDLVLTIYDASTGFGHIGGGVNTKNTVGFYPVIESGSYFQMAAGNSVRGIVKPDINSVRRTITIPTSEETDKKMEDAIEEKQGNPGKYNFENDNCVTWLKEITAIALKEHGKEIKTGIRTPEQLGNFLVEEGFDVEVPEDSENDDEVELGP